MSPRTKNTQTKIVACSYFSWCSVMALGVKLGIHGDKLLYLTLKLACLLTQCLCMWPAVTSTHPYKRGLLVRRGAATHSRSVLFDVFLSCWSILKWRFISQYVFLRSALMYVTCSPKRKGVFNGSHILLCKPYVVYFMHIDLLLKSFN